MRRLERLPKRGRRVLGLPANYVISDFAELDSVGSMHDVQNLSTATNQRLRSGGSATAAANQTPSQPFGQLRAAWNSRGLGFGVRVRGKQNPPVCDPDSPAESDGMQIWIDTRNTKNIHRASRFCHHFCLLPNGSAANLDQPRSVQISIPQAREHSPQSSSDKVRVSSESFNDGYGLDAWFPAESLCGFDFADEDHPQQNPMVGFYYCLRDQELGEQFLSVGREFPFAHDPSLWATLELVRD